MPNTNDSRPGRPTNLDVPFHMAKTLWGGVWQKFCDERMDKIKNLTNGAKLEMLAQIVEIGLEPVKKLKREIERTPSPNTVAMSKVAISGLCDYLPDEEMKQKIFASVEDPEVMKLDPYFGWYRLYWREKRNGAWSVRSSKMQLGAGETRVVGELSPELTGGRAALKNMNLFCAVEDEYKISQFIFNVGTVEENNLNFIPGLCLTVNASAVPTMVAVLLVRENQDGDEPDEAFLNRYFDRYCGRSLVRGIPVDWFLNGSNEYRIGGLFGNWYIYSANVNGIIRRGKICIPSEYNLRYQGTRHEFKKGRIEIFNHTCVVLDFDNDYKHLHLIGRIGDGSDLQQRRYIPCIYSSTGNEGRTLKSGVSIMRKETEKVFEEMTTGVYTADNYPQELEPKDLKFLLRKKGGEEH
ncbi:MAG: hypothetical protein KIS77_17485 [Saprospiraceae bacterium]|nr:hypothetical protein [Saprospiraceae bacterium]